MVSPNTANNDPKVLILVIHGPYEPWISIYKQGQLQTWMEDSANIRVLNYFGKRMKSKYLGFDQKVYFLRWNKSQLIAYTSLLFEALIKRFIFLHKFNPRVRKKFDEDLGEIWEVSLPDSLLLQGVKNLAALRNALDFEFDYLVTTISSTYIHYSALISFLNKSPRERFLGGRIEKSGVNEYQQGSFRVYSRDVVKYLVENRKKYKHWQIEDIAMANLARIRYKALTELPNISVSSIECGRLLRAVSLKEVCSVRCKSVLEDGKRQDAEIMQIIHTLIKTG
jgi:hypothetical protein